jgi:L-ascorbate metabolism protein UlaG (beta-lactamase superfamily)
MKLTFYGQSCWLAELNGVKLLFDPFISPNELAKNIDVSKIEADYVLITHGHEDHVADAESILKRTGAKLVSTFEIVNWYSARGIENAHPMNIGGKWNFDFGTVHFFTALHSSSMPDGSYGGNPGSFLIETDDKNFYHAGDTGLTMDMKLIPEILKLDFAMLPIGDDFTMGYKEAIKASDFIQCDNILAMHYDTFGYIEVDKDKVIEAFESANKKITFFEIGETKDLK